MDTKKRLLIIATILLIGLVIIGSTYAFWTWTSNTTKNVIFNTAEELKKYIVYDEGESKFSGNFEVSSSFNQGMHSTISLYKTGEAANVDLIATIHMNINSIGTNMANSTALKWVVTSGTSNNPGSIITQGNFINVSTGDVLTLVPNVNVTTTETFYNVWIWLDESENPSSSLTGETLDVNVWTEFNQNEGVEDRFEITQMTNSYQQINATIIDNKNTIVGYNITTTETEPSTWLDIPSNDQNNIYNFSYSAPDIGTYYIWFIDSGGNITHEVVEVTTIDSTPPVCTFGSWNKTIIGETETAKITLTCTDTDTGINNVNLNTTDITVSNSNLTVTNIVKSTTTNGYTYEITVTGANTNGNTTITLSPDAISNTAGLGNESLTSSAIMVDNEGPTITAQASTTVDMTNYIDVTMSDISGILGYNITTSSTAPTTWIPLNSYVEASTETKYEDSAAWARVFHHGVHGGAVLFSDDTEALSVNTTDKYSVLGNIENYRNGSNKFEFMLQYPDYSLTEYNRWRQTDNPTTTSIANGDGTEFVNGYEAVHIDWATSRWTGMALSSSTSTFMDGEVSHSNWHYAIGAHSAYRNGVPSIPNVTNYNASTQYVNLWARIDDKATTIPTGQIIRRIGDIRSNGTYYVWAKDKNGKTSYQTVTINKVDNTKPTVSLTGSGTSATITMSDNVGVVKYYFGATNPSTTNITWTTITSTTNTTINQTVSAAGTQYLIAMDAAGNVATTTLEYTQITGTFYYQSNATSGSETVSSTTASCIKASTDSGCSVTIPSAVKSSVGKYNNAYAGLSSSTGNMTQAVASGTTSVNLSTDTSYYAIYRSSVTNYYYGTSYTSRTLYRNQWFTSTTAMATTVLSTSTTGTSNYSTAVGPGSSVWSGLSTAADTTAEYANVAAAATSASGTLYTVYQFNITYAKSTNVSSIGATSGSCKVSATGASAGGTSCSVTLPTITANTGYTVQGWYTATGGGGTKAGNASASYTVSSTGATLYAYAKDTTAPTGSVTATLNGTTVNATVSASDTGSGLATTGTYGWKISSSSTCNSSVTGWTTNTNASYNFTGQSAGTLYVCVRVADKSGNYGYLSTQVKVKAYLKVVAYNTAYRTSTYSTKIKTVKFVQGVSNSGAVASWDLSENADNKVIGWIKNNTSNTSFYDLYIGSNYSIYAKNLYQEFLGLSNATSFDLNNLNTIECTNMYAMFSGACNNGNNSTLTFNFGSSFDTRNVTDMSQMFSSAAAYANNVNINITADFNTSNVTNTYYMFASVGDQCKGNVLINLGNNFSIPKVTNATDMFSQVGGNTTKNVTIKLGSNFNATNLTNTYGMFARIGHNAPSVNINLGNNFNLSNAQNADRMFYATARNSANVYIDLGNNFNGSKLKSTLEMFEDAGFFQTSSYSLNLGNNFITSNVTTMKNMFRDSGGNATNFSINLGSHFDMTNVNNAFQMFHNVGNKSTKAFILNLAPGTLAKMGTICNGYSGCYGMFEGVPSGKVTVYVKDSTTRQWFINQNSNWGTSFSASNVLIK